MKSLISPDWQLLPEDAEKFWNGIEGFAALPVIEKLSSVAEEVTGKPAACRLCQQVAEVLAPPDLNPNLARQERGAALKR